MSQISVSHSIDEIEEIYIAFEYGEAKAIVVLKETETITECGETETVNKEIEIEAEIEDISDNQLQGDLAFGEEIEQDNGGVKEFIYKGSFDISGEKMTLKLSGEFDDEETESITLNLEK